MAETLIKDEEQALAKYSAWAMKAARLGQSRFDELPNLHLFLVYGIECWGTIYERVGFLVEDKTEFPKEAIHVAVRH
jgi:hypothetical protein